MIKKVVIGGEGGQGIRLAGTVLAKILAKIGYEVSLTFEYDADVRGGKVIAFLTYSDKKIENPIVEEPDILLHLSEIEGEYKAKKTVCEKGLCTEEEIPFNQIANEKFGSPFVVNMLAIGRLLRLLEIDISNINLEKELPPQFIEKNVEAIKYGYIYKDSLH